MIVSIWCRSCCNFSRFAAGLLASSFARHRSIMFSASAGRPRKRKPPTSFGLLLSILVTAANASFASSCSISRSVAVVAFLFGNVANGLRKNSCTLGSQ